MIIVKLKEVTTHVFVQFIRTNFLFFSKSNRMRLEEGNNHDNHNYYSFKTFLIG